MKVKIAESAGFCFGVKRAVESVYKEIENNKKKKQIYTYGPIIHNEEVVKDLKDKGVIVLDSLEELKNVTSGIVIIRSHGTSEDAYNVIKENNLTLVDETCPFVLPGPGSDHSFSDLLRAHSPLCADRCNALIAAFPDQSARSRVPDLQFSALPHFQCDRLLTDLPLPGGCPVWKNAGAYRE